MATKQTTPKPQPKPKPAEAEDTRTSIQKIREGAEPINLWPSEQKGKK